MWWEPPSFFNKIVSDSPFKSVHAMPGLLRHGSHQAFTLMARLFLALGTLEKQGSSASCSHLRSRWGKDDNSQLTVSTALWRGGLENLVVWMVPLPVHLSWFSESSEECEGGQDAGCSSQQEMGCCFSFCSHTKVAQYLKPYSFSQQPRYFLALSKTMTQSLWELSCPLFFFSSFWYFFFPSPVPPEGDF